MTRENFLKLVEAIRAQMERDVIAPQHLKEAIDTIQDHFDWVEINWAERDKPATVVENLACTIAAAIRAAETVYAKVPDKVIETAAKAYAP